MQPSRFQGSRLREAREARGLTQSALSELTDIAAARLSHYENDRHQPADEIAAKLATSLNIPMHFFYRIPRDESELRHVFWRSKLSAKAIERARVSRRFDWLLDTYSFLDQHVHLPQVDLPSLVLPSNPGQIDYQYIESAADALREHWGLGRGPISNIVGIMESRGFVTSVQPMYDDYLDAFSEWSGRVRRPVVFLGSDKVSYARRLFTAAHEIGHMLIHREIPLDRYQSSAQQALIEKQADYFASCFLLPAETFTADVYSVSLDALRSLKHRWLVAISAMIMRLHQLKILDDDEKQRAFIQMSRRKWRKCEPGDDITVSDNPQLTENAFSVLLESNRFTPDAIEHYTGLSTSDIESVTGLPAGFLRNRIQNPFQLKLAR